ncbi:MAG: DNA polymerase III subunit beta [Kiritimatiellia bacterium]
MKFNIDKDCFIKGLQMAQSVIATHSSEALLYNVMIVADEGKLSLSAMDVSVSMRYTLDEVDIKENGATTIHARRLFGLVRELPGEKIEFASDDKDVAVIQSGSSNYKMYGISSEEFPPVSDGDAETAFTIAQVTLREMFKKTVYAVSNDESRQILNGILISVGEQKMVMVATDGRRLALVEQEIEIPGDVSADVVIPTKTVNELVKVLQDDGSVKIKMGEGMVSFELDNILIVSKLIKGSYPNYRQVIPEQCEEKATVDRENFLATLKRVAYLAKEKGVPVRLTFEQNQMRIFASIPDVGEANETVPIKYTGKQIVLAFNPDFLMDPLRSLSSDEIYIEMVDDLSPAVIKSDVPFLYVIMPLRLS